MLGTFARIFISNDISGQGVPRMKNAVLVDMTSMMLWFVSGLFGLVVWLGLEMNSRERHAEGDDLALENQR